MRRLIPRSNRSFLKENLLCLVLCQCFRLLLYGKTLGDEWIRADKKDSSGAFCWIFLEKGSREWGFVLVSTSFKSSKSRVIILT